MGDQSAYEAVGKRRHVASERVTAMGNVKSGFKVVYVKNFRYFSCYMARSAVAAVEYYINRWSEPRAECGPLCVFDNVWDAVICRDHLISKRNGVYKIFPCLYVSSEHERVYTSLDAGVAAGVSKALLLPGTVLAEKVMLQHQVIKELVR